MTDQHPLEQLLRDAKENDDMTAAARVEEQRKTLDLQEKVRLQWLQTKASLTNEIERANAVLEKHNVRERYSYRETPESGTGNVSRGNLALAYPAPSKSTRAEYDMTVAAADGRVTLLHRATGQRHQNLTIFTASGKTWETSLTALYRDHLKKARDPGQNPQDPSPVIESVAKSR